MTKASLLIFALLGFFVCVVPSVSDHDTNETTEVQPTNSRRQLGRAMRRSESVQFIYASSDATSAETYRRLIDSIRQHLPEEWSVPVNSEHDYKPGQLSAAPLVLLGHNFQEPAVKTLLSELPFRQGPGQFTFNGEVYDQPDDSFRLFLYPNPENDTLPIYYIGGNSPAAIAEQLKASEAGRGFFWRSWGYEIYEGGKVVVRGYLDDHSWEMDPDQHFDLRRPNMQVLRTEHFAFHDMAGLGEEFVQQLASECEEQLQTLRAFTGSDRPVTPVAYYLYPSIEFKGLRLMNTDEGHAHEAEREVHLVINDIFSGQHTEHDLRLLLADLLGAADHPAVALGLAVRFKPHWQQKGANYWAARLHHSNNLPSLRELLDLEWFENESPLVLTAASGALIDFLLQYWGKERLLDAYRSWPALSDSELDRLEASWHRSLDQLTIGQGEKKQATLPYYRGFNFAHEGYQVYNGYGSELARRSLARLQEIGANAVAIVPYGFLRRADVPAFPGVRHRAGSENDESVIYAHHQAQSLGMYTMMKPQIWLSGSWPGAIEMTNEADWDQFFDHYYRWIRHYALLAEMRQFDVLCVGVELGRTTLARPEQWRDMIRRLRGLYSGPITYAANWGEEFEQLSFWDELDFIGLNCYYPLSKEEKPSRKALQSAMQDIVSRAHTVSKVYEKPVVLTEVGFRSVAGTWKNPHAEADGRPYDGEAQSLCYEILFEGIEGEDWIKGLFLWKWPSYLDYQRHNQVGFAPAGRPAEQVVARWYGSRLGD